MDLDVINKAEIHHEGDEHLIEIGQWYWVKVEESDRKYDKEYYSTIRPFPDYPWLACVVTVGSNYAEVKSSGLRGTTSRRIHFDKFNDQTILEPNPKKILNENRQYHQHNINKYMLEIKRVTVLLGVSHQEKIESFSSSRETALVVQSSNQSAKEYKNQLIKAKDNTLPELFEKIKIENEHVVKWMTAETMELEAAVDSLKGCLSIIKKRILNVTLYTGITEQIIHVKEGKPAEYADKIHLMQRRLYMDEECLLNYKVGGMEFKNIGEFDEWLSEDSNLSRCLPFPKCIVTFQIRRNTKDRGHIESLGDAYIRIDLEHADTFTYMYIRNGENLYRLVTDMEFGEKIFPDTADFDPTVPMMVRPYGNDTISLSRWEVEKADHEEKVKNSKKWEKENPFSEWLKSNPFDNKGDKRVSRNDNWAYQYTNPYDLGWGGERFDMENWELFDKSNVRYDDVLKAITDQVDQYNRIALIVQGILDRSEILHPHPPIRSEKENDFQSMIKLIYDGGAVLYNGDVPDILEYIDNCNKSADKDSVFIGQLDYYMRKEAKKEGDRILNNWRRTDSEPEIFLCYGDPGPEYISGCIHFTRTKKATFEWHRERRTYDYWNDEPIKVKITVPLDKLFNVSAYKPGDFKRFFNDPRTRINYLKWASLLLAAEDWHAEIVRNRYGRIKEQS